MARQPGAPSAVAMALALVLAMAMAMVLAVSAQEPPSRTTLTVRNDFPAQNLSVQCDNDSSERNRPAHLLLPTQTYEVNFDPAIVHRWTCNLMTDPYRLCGEAAFNGEFILYENSRLPIPPHSKPLCLGQCAWLADNEGVSLVRQPGTQPDLIYRWPNIC